MSLVPVVLVLADVTFALNVHVILCPLQSAFVCAAAAVVVTL